MAKKDSSLRSYNKCNRSPAYYERPRTPGYAGVPLRPPRTPTGFAGTSCCLQCQRPMDRNNANRNRRFCSGCYHGGSGGGKGYSGQISPAVSVNLLFCDRLAGIVLLG